MSEGTPFVSRLTGKGKITVPKNIRDLFNLVDGDYVEGLIVRKVKPESKEGEPDGKPG